MSTAAAACQTGDVPRFATKSSRISSTMFLYAACFRLQLAPYPHCSEPNICWQEDPPLDDSFLAGIKEEPGSSQVLVNRGLGLAARDLVSKKGVSGLG